MSVFKEKSAAKIVKGLSPNHLEMRVFPFTSVSHRDWAFYDCRIPCCQDETKGDKYLVVGGITVPITSHAQRVANLAFGMGVASQEIMNPMVEEPFQVGMTEYLL